MHIIHLLIIQLLAAAAAAVVGAFNIDTSSYIVHRGAPGSHFGYAVAQHRDREVNHLLVGAPRAQTDQPQTNRSGAVYRCSVNASNNCQQIPFDPNGSSSFQLEGKQKYSDNKSQQWFGATLQSAGGHIVACAPHYIYHFTNLNHPRRDPVGSCWLSRGSFAGFLEYSPCRLNDQHGHERLGSCQAGFSAAMSRDGSGLYMGAPGAHVWQGLVFAHNLTTDLQRTSSWLNPVHEDDSYVGYSLALVRLAAASGDQLAVGVPRGAELAGKIMLLDRDMRVLFNLTGEQVGAYFGYSLAVADVNGDGNDDLLVGAPLYFNAAHKTAHPERGRLYVYLQRARNQQLELAQTLDGARDWARFGHSLANCGDLNHDGFQDVAVGAPFDGPRGRGAVHIFMGGRLGLAREPNQVIYAESLHPDDAGQLRRFGFSLSGNMDMDKNGYPDLLVGDYLGARAVLLRARPVANVSATLAFQPDHFNLDDKSCLLPGNNTGVACIRASYCLKYTGYNVDARLNFLVDVRLDTERRATAPRLFFLTREPAKTEESFERTLFRDREPVCIPFSAYISKQVRDKLTPLKIEIEYRLAEPDSTNVVPDNTGQKRLRPILNQSTPSKLVRLANIHRNCGSLNVCTPDLRLQMSSNVLDYTIGSKQEIVLDVAVRNYGDDAFEAMFYLTMPSTIRYNIVDPRPDYLSCLPARQDLTGANVVTCDLGNPLPKNQLVKFSIRTQPADGPFIDQDFTFIGTVNSTNPELDQQHREDNEVAIGISIGVETNLSVTGNSSPPLVTHNLTRVAPTAGAIKYDNSYELELGEQEVNHTYILQNRGPSTINDLAFVILWPSKHHLIGDYLLYLIEEPIASDPKIRCKPPPRDAVNPRNYLSLARARYQVSPALPDSSLYGAKSKRDTMAQLLTAEPADPFKNLEKVKNCRAPYCHRFDCNVYNLGHNETVTIKMKSILVEKTLDKVSERDYDISSNLIAIIRELPYNVSVRSMSPYSFKVKTEVLAIGHQETIPWWLIILAILLGLVLLILLACFLKYLGFFDRRRPAQRVE